MDQQRIFDALRAVQLAPNHLVQFRPAGTCYCGLGALLHYAGISDPDLADFEDPRKDLSSDEIIDAVMDTWHSLLATTYGLGPDRIRMGRVLEHLLQLVDVHDMRDPYAIATRLVARESIFT